MSERVLRSAGRSTRDNTLASLRGGATLRRGNPVFSLWIASSLSLLAMTVRFFCACAIGGSFNAKGTKDAKVIFC